MTVSCSECQKILEHRNPRFKNDSKKYNFCSDKCKKRFYRKLEFNQQVPDSVNSEIPDKLNKLMSLSVTNTVVIRKDHLLHHIMPRRFTFVSFYCVECKSFTHRTDVRETLTRSMIRVLQLPPEYREKYMGRFRESSIPYDPQRVKDEMKLREDEETI